MVRLLLVGIVLPVALCATVLSAAWRPWRAEAPLGAGRWVSAVAFGVAFLIAGFAAGAFSKFPPHSTWQWIVYVAMAAAIMGGADAPSRLKWPLRAVLACGTSLLLVGAWVDYHWAWRAVWGLMVLLLVAGLDPLRGRGGAAIPLGLCVAFTGASVVLALAPVIKFATMAASTAGCLGAAAILARWRPGLTPLGGAMPLFAVTLPGLLLSGLTTSDDVRTWPFLLSAAAPAGLLVGRNPVLRVSCVLTLALAAVAGAAYNLTSSHAA